MRGSGWPLFPVDFLAVCGLEDAAVVELLGLMGGGDETGAAAEDNACGDKDGSIWRMALYGSWLYMAHGSLLLAQALGFIWLMAHGSWLLASRLRPMEILLL